MGYRSASRAILDFVYTNGFITNKSQMAITQLTDSITLRPGTWLLMIKTPYSTSTGKCILNIYGISGTEFLIGEGFSCDLSYGTLLIPIRITATKSIYLESGSSSATYTWDSNYLTRGGLAAVRVSA